MSEDKFIFDVKAPSKLEGEVTSPEIKIDGNSEDTFQFNVRAPSKKDFEKTKQPVLVDPITGAIIGSGVGFAAGSLESMAPRLFPEVFDGKQVFGSPGEKWARKITGYVDPRLKTVTEQAQAYQRAGSQSPALKRFYQMFPPAAPGEPAAAFERMLERKKAAEAAAEAVRNQGLAQKLFPGLGRIPFGSTAMGALSGLQIGQAIERQKKGDIPGAAISGAGGAGALASLIPKAAPRLIGGGVGLASIPAQFVYEAIKGIGQEREKNVGTKTGYLQRLKELGEEPTESEVLMAQSAGPALSRDNLFVPEPTRFAGGLPRTPQ